MRVDGIVLDLDDTIYDTSAKLLPAADRRAVETLRRHGLPLAVGTAVARVAALRRSGVTTAFRALAAEHGLPEAAALQAERSFFCFDVPPIALEPDVVAALVELRSIAPLALLTMGDLATQRAKSSRLGLAAWFGVQKFVGLDAPGGKTAALRRLVEEQGWAPERTVFAGDRPDGDVRAANRAGCLAVLVRSPGTEFGDAEPGGPDEVPWRTIAHVRELPSVLRSA